MIDIDELRQQIANLVLNYPELENDEVLRADMIDAETDIHDALKILVRSIDDSEFMVVGITERRKELAARKDRLEHRVEKLRELILSILQSANLKKMQLPDVTLTQVNSQRQIVGEPDPNALPDEFVRIKREADRAAIREALLAGRSIEGLTLSNAAPHLMIRSK